MLVHNIFTSIQGEGFYIGEISVFVRFLGCDLDCDWCDTKYAQEGAGEEYEPEELAAEIVEKCHDVGTDVVVITGGEPFVQKKGLLNLIEALPDRLKITIETHGGIVIPEELYENTSVFLSISPKLSNANTTYKEKYFDKNTLNINKNDFWNYQVKFVIDTDDIEEDIQEASKLIRRTMLPEHTSITFQPMSEGEDTVEDLLEKQRKLTEYILEEDILKKCDIRVLPQLQTLIYGRERGR